VNILTVSRDLSKFRFRSDSSLIRSQERYYIPDFVDSLSFSPIVCFRCSRPGKAVEERFAHRYVESFGYGILLHPELSPSVTENRDFITSSLDFTTVIPVKDYPFSDYDAASGPGSLSVTLNGHTVADSPVLPGHDEIGVLIAGITRFTTIRTGDLIAVELTDRIAAGREQRICLRLGDELLTGILVL